MKKLSLIVLAFLLLIGATALPARTSAAQGAGLISSVFNKIERNRRDLKSLRANVIIQKVDPRFGEEMSYGSVHYVSGSGREANVLLEINRPRQEILAVKDGKYVLYKPKMKVAYTGRSNKVPGGQGSVLSFVFNASSAQLKANFVTEPGGEGTIEGAHVFVLKLTPKSGADFKFAEIWVDDSGMPVQTRITERNGDSTLVRLTGIRKNVPVPSKTFDLQPPSGTKFVQS
jgi:outer membrane lipoprotein-sorting protein